MFEETVLSNMTKYQSETNLMLTMGGDFNFQIANLNYQNLDKLIKYVNERSEETGIRAFYSTPSCFLKALNDESLTWPTKTDDFFPYADGKVVSSLFVAWLSFPNQLHMTPSF